MAHDPPRISLHSIQDGQEERTLPVVMPLSASRRSSRIIGIWWFQQERKITQSAIPDIFKRNETIVRAYNWQGGGELFDLMREFADRYCPFDSEDITSPRPFARRRPKADVSLLVPYLLFIH